jgi:haloacetate dehalogenase
VLQVWREYATDVRGRSLSCGHYLAEESPDETYDALKDFFAGNPVAHQPD